MLPTYYKRRELGGKRKKRAFLTGASARFPQASNFHLKIAQPPPSSPSFQKSSLNLTARSRQDGGEFLFFGAARRDGQPFAHTSRKQPSVLSKENGLARDEFCVGFDGVRARSKSSHKEAASTRGVGSLFPHTTQQWFFVRIILVQTSTFLQSRGRGQPCCEQRERLFARAHQKTRTRCSSALHSTAAPLDDENNQLPCSSSPPPPQPHPKQKNTNTNSPSSAAMSSSTSCVS